MQPSARSRIDDEVGDWRPDIVSAGEGLQKPEQRRFCDRRARPEPRQYLRISLQCPRCLGIARIMTRHQLCPLRANEPRPILFLSGEPETMLAVSSRCVGPLSCPIPDQKPRLRSSLTSEMLRTSTASGLPRKTSNRVLSSSRSGCRARSSPDEDQAGSCPATREADADRHTSARPARSVQCPAWPATRQGRAGGPGLRHIVRSCAGQLQGHIGAMAS